MARARPVAWAKASIHPSERTPRWRVGRRHRVAARLELYPTHPAGRALAMTLRGIRYFDLRTVDRGLWETAVEEGKRRTVWSLDHNANHRYGDGYTWEGNIEGALGEAWFHLWSGLEWTAFEHYKKGEKLPDVGSLYEVKTTRYAKGELLVHDDDQASPYAVLLTGSAGRYHLRGWIETKRACSGKWWREKEELKYRWMTPAHFIPPSELYFDPWPHVAGGGV